MTRMAIPDLIHKFRFLFRAGGRSYGVTRIACDPFSDDVWIYRGIESKGSERDELLDQLRIQVGSGEGKVQVFMFNRTPSAGVQALARVIVVQFKAVDYKPLDLDAADSGFALEAFVLRQATCSKPMDVDPAEIGL